MKTGNFRNRTFFHCYSIHYNDKIKWAELLLGPADRDVRKQMQKVTEYYSKLYGTRKVTFMSSQLN